MKKPLAIEGTRALCEAGAINHVQLVASSDGVHVELNQSLVVANRDRQVRYFAKSDTCFGWLRGIGITKIDGVDLTHWGEAKKPTAPKRVPKRR